MKFLHLASQLGFAALLLVSSSALAQTTAANPVTRDSREVSSSFSTVAITTSMQVLDDKRPLGSGDRVSYRVVEERKPPIGLLVTDSGEMEVPLIGRVTAKGKTCKSLAFEIKAALEKEYFYTCNVILGLDAASTKALGSVYVMGQVRTQGSVEIPPDQNFTVSRAILRAGGFSSFANKQKVKLVRTKPDGSQETHLINLVEVLEKGRADRDLPLRPDDLIVVPERLINF